MGYGHSGFALGCEGEVSGQVIRRRKRRVGCSGLEEWVWLPGLRGSGCFLFSFGRRCFLNAPIVKLSGQ